jgi:hypothetical protein
MSIPKIHSLEQGKNGVVCSSKTTRIFLTQ